MSENDAISSELLYIERNQDVRVLYACDAGSRTWGYESPDSDYDVKFVYIRPLKSYLGLGKTPDTLDWRIESGNIDLKGDFDGSGWDICKFLRLMRTSNPSVFEWLSSDAIYREDSEWYRVRKASRDCFSPKKIAYHYYGMAKNQDFKHIKSGRVTRKKYMYIIRSILAARWALRRYAPAPMDLKTLLDAHLEPYLRPVVDDLLASRADEPEGTIIKRIKDLDEWIDESLTEINHSASMLASREKADIDELNAIFFTFLGL